MYSERRTGPAWLRVLGTVAAAIVVGVLVVVVPAIGRSWGTPSATVLAAALVAIVVIVGLAAATASLNRIEVRVGRGRVEGWLAPFRVFSVRASEIDSVDETAVTVAQAGGIGYRMRPSTRLLLFDGGSAARLRTRAGRSYVLRSNSVPRLIEAVEAEVEAAAAAEA